MSPNEILTSSPLDLLFQNRNKQYGAYILRKQYNSRLWTSLGISLSMLPLLFLLFGQGSNVEEQRSHGETVIVRDFSAKRLKDPVIKPEKVTPLRHTPVVQKRFVNRINMVENNKVVPRFTPQGEMDGVAPGTSDQPGFSNNGLQVESHSIVGKEMVTKPEPPAPLEQREPEYPGGVKAWLTFLQKNLRVPGDLGEGEKKTVLIRFQVATDGMVTGFEILQSGGSVYDNEVIRVLKKMPRWKPAIQNNVPVSRSFTQPVTFMGVGE